MKRKRVGKSSGRSQAGRRDGDFCSMLRRICRYADRSASKMDFFLEAARMLAAFTGSDAVELLVKESDRCFLACRAVRRPKRSFSSEVLPAKNTAGGGLIPERIGDAGLAKVYEDLLCGTRRLDRRWFTPGGSFWTNDSAMPLTIADRSEGQKRRGDSRIGGRHRSLAVLPLAVGNEPLGLLLVRNRRKGFFTEEILELCEDIVRSFSVSLAYQVAKSHLNERVKELTCLYGIMRVAGRRDLPLEKVLESIASNLPPAWQYPEIASARIVLGDWSCLTPGFKGELKKQRADIVVEGERRGFVEIVYAEGRPELDEGPFLKEERRLIDAVAGQIAMIVRQRQADGAAAELRVRPGQPGRPAGSMSLQAILFDFGGVISEEGFIAGLREIGRRAGRDPLVFQKTAGRLAFSSGFVTGKIEEAAYWSLVREKTGIGGSDEDLRGEILGRFILRPKVLEIVRRAKAAGRIVGILSDQTNWLEELDRKAPFCHLFDHVFNSFRTGRTKQDPSVFGHVCAAMGVEAGRVLLVDDSPANLRVAAGEGLRTIHFTTVEEFEKQIEPCVGGKK